MLIIVVLLEELAKVELLKVYKKIKKQNKTVAKFGYIEVEKQQFHQYEGPVSIKKHRY